MRPSVHFCANTGLTDYYSSGSSRVNTCHLSPSGGTHDGTATDTVCSTALWTGCSTSGLAVSYSPRRSARGAPRRSHTRLEGCRPSFHYHRSPPTLHTTGTGVSARWSGSRRSLAFSRVDVAHVGLQFDLEVESFRTVRALELQRFFVAGVSHRYPSRARRDPSPRVSVATRVNHRCSTACTHPNRFDTPACQQTRPAVVFRLSSALV